MKIKLLIYNTEIKVEGTFTSIFLSLSGIIIRGKKKDGTVIDLILIGHSGGVILRPSNLHASLDSVEIIVEQE